MTTATEQRAHLTPADLEAQIAGETYFTAADGVLGAYRNNGDVYQGTNVHHEGYRQVTFCVLVLRNGTKVVGVNYGSIDPARHDAQMGREAARAEAFEQLWPLMGYELRGKLAAQQAPAS